ncbi:YhgE/Pip-like protein [Paenibacillus taihuensis]|uniref:YhgE/Pip-like protein n=1 Tax=Paenibacillus taihuensis TaxID=1156355 RepID=A0A3D9RNJ4_9BACL|nr:ABC transporter permease [Paenibacillus taihuensis]REE77689.1 YhgE/Pip-like protein [Paenibacillus taihuensis]
MKQAWRAYWKIGQTKLAVIVALMAQMIFCIFWMTAYHGVLDRTDQLKIAIVNEDSDFGARIADQLKASLPFQVEKLTKEKALAELEQRDVQLMVTIPSGFGREMMTPDKKAEVSFTLNEANAQLPKGIMQSVSEKITDKLVSNAEQEGMTAVLKQLQVPGSKANELADELHHKVGSHTTILHPVNGMENQMVPMMLILGSFVGAMLMGMNVHQVSLQIGTALTKVQHFAFRVVYVIPASLVVSLAGTSIIAAFGGQMEHGMLTFWLFHWLTVMTFMFFAQLFLMTFGLAGMFINMSLLSLQLVSSGTIVPKQMLSHAYQELSGFLPATYAVDGLMNVQFGGVHTLRDIGILLAFAGGSIAAGYAVTMLKKQPFPAKQAEKSAGQPV